MKYVGYLFISVCILTISFIFVLLQRNKYILIINNNNKEK